MSRVWTPEQRAAAADRMRAQNAARRAALAATAAQPAAPPPPVAPIPAASELFGAPVSERTAWDEARKMLLARMSVVEVSQALELPTSRVSQLAQQLGVAKSKIMKEARNG